MQQNKENIKINVQLLFQALFYAVERFSGTNFYSRIYMYTCKVVGDLFHVMSNFYFF